MRVLVACEFSGIVRDAFYALGHDAWSCDLLPSEKPGQHYQCDIREILESKLITGGFVPPFDLMIAHPDCTYLCSSGLHWNKRVHGREQKTLDALDFVRLLMNAPILKIAIENPIGKINTAIRAPDQYIQPYEYGHDASKRTGLWLKNLPLLRPTNFIEPRMVCCGAEVQNGDKYGCPNCNGDKVARPRWGNQCDSGQNKLGPSPNRWKERARTYQGWADAMAAQWGG